MGMIPVDRAGGDAATKALDVAAGVLERGELVELGSHENLLEKGGIYTTLYEKQVIAEELEIGV